MKAEWVGGGVPQEERWRRTDKRKERLESEHSERLLERNLILLPWRN